MVWMVYFILSVFYNKKVIFTVRVTKESCEFRARKIKVTISIQNVDLIWNHVKKQKVNWSIIVPVISLRQIFGLYMGMTSLRCHPLAWSTTVPNSPFPGDGPGANPTSTHPHTRMERKTDERRPTPGPFICVDRISLSNNLLRHKLYIGSCELKCSHYHKCTKWSVCKKSNSSNSMGHRWQARCWGKHRS